MGSARSSPVNAQARSRNGPRRSLRKAREVEHDVQIYRAYEREAERLQERGARIERVVLDCELKREYQQFLQERNRGPTTMMPTTRRAFSNSSK